MALSNLPDAFSKVTTAAGMFPYCACISLSTNPGFQVETRMDARIVV